MAGRKDVRPFWGTGVCVRSKAIESSELRLRAETMAAAVPALAATAASLVV